MSTSEIPSEAAAPSGAQPEKQSDAPLTSPNDAPPSAAANSNPTSMDVSPAPETAFPLETPQSQPMTATASSSSQNPPQDNGNAATSAIYGTRSRNRTGTRPNYAEDKDLDLELEANQASPKTSRSNKRSSAAAAAAAASATEQHTTSSGFAAINNSVADLGSDNAPTGGTSTPVPAPTPAPSKKRKHPSSSLPAATNHTMPANSRSRHAAPLPLKGFVETNMMSFSRCGRKLNAKKQLVADDGTAVQTNDHVYMVCEPPGEPYYLARVMEFLHAKNDPEAPVDAIRVNWYYRPKDILRRVQDTRVVFASMHSDTCPLNSIRGKCNIQHLSDISNMDEYRSQQDSFWFDKLFDRYMHRYYEVIPTHRVVNVPQHVKMVLDERWKFVLVEIGRGRELTSESKKCTRCEQFASNHDSVDCAVCKRTYHMQCVRPPLLKKPARGFAWACAACSRAQEMKMDSRNTPASETAHGEDDDFMDEDEDESGAKIHDTRESSAAPEAHPAPTAAQIAQANLWPWRYLGVHSRVEDALDYDDRIYPRASSRLGPRHQANVNVWHGRPVELVKPAEIKKKYKNADGKRDRRARDSGIDTEKDNRLKRPKWVVDEPVGYIVRGQDEPVDIKGKKEHTAQLIFKLPEHAEPSDRGTDDSARPQDAEELVDEYMKKVKPIAAQYNLLDSSVDFLTKAIEKLQENNFNVDKALDAMRGLSLRADLKQPDLNREEIKRFEEGVAKYGSELHAVSRHVGSSVKESRIVRFYYMWKKTEKGQQIWGNYEGRRSKKESKRADKDGNIKLLDEVADDKDDSAFDEEKAAQKKRGFVCKFCGTHHSRQWRRAPATPPGTLVPKDSSAKNSKDKSAWLTLALCGRCAYLWRKYAVQYEDIEEVSKKIAASGSRAAKRRVDEELLRLILEAHQMSGDPIPPRAVDEVNKAGIEVPHSIIQPEEPPKKKGKTDKDGANATPDVVPEKKKAPEKPQEPPPIEPDPPKVKIHPCAICRVIDVPSQELLKCRDCRLHVHGSCYGVGSKTNTKPWFCDMCRNDHNLQVSTTYECVLCPVKFTHQELMEPLKPTHKKKTDRDREKERIEREIIQEASRRWRMEQEAAGRPVNPREALKRTAWNNWMHITCALWTKEIKFGNAELLDDAEGVGFIPPERFEPVCKLCKQGGLPTVKCHQSNCNTFFHVGCAHQAEYVFGFDVAPVKSSRRDSVNVIKLQSESGIVTAGIWCPTHTPTTFVHNMLEPTEGGLTAMQLFARTYKQVDNSVTGTVRRAAQFIANLPVTAPAVQPISRRGSIINGLPNGMNGQYDGPSVRSSPAAESPRDLGEGSAESRKVEETFKRTTGQKKCCTCLVDVSPRWWPLQPAETQAPVANGLVSSLAPDHATHNGSQDVVMTNGIVKAEPADTSSLSNITHTKDRSMWQCHKCHILKRTPPSSPSQVRPREKPPSEPAPAPAPAPAPEPFAYHSSYAAPPPAAYSLNRPPLEGALPPPHAHPAAAPPPPPGAALHQPPSWQSPSGWSSSAMPVGRRPSPPPLGGGYPAAYRSQYEAPGYGRPPHHSYSTVPPPLPPPPTVGHLAQHSPPSASYVAPPHQTTPATSTPPQPARPPSPSRYDRPPGPSPHLGLQSSILSRSFAPEPHRQPSMGSPVNGYSALHSATPRLYGQVHPPPPPPPAVPRQSPSAQSLAQIAQAATEQGGRTHSRQASVEVTNTPRFGPRSFPESPQQRPITPAGAAGLRDERRDGPGASASPSLKNLLS
ncbi:putative PHD type zinc finger protein with BAH domain-containing protein [Exophiala xenobiotica]|nr:putative PHD type zinc finger protein with BAH domain-containing protein [Exophiala xenobiotica]KAK5223869.1 putative PHD type zinc finger protein with BAH domain-containing protein [Exophiala xenobiotica]KAK5273537.1 putative PHD type zinc finger protein with BAH domain-containing protein [Exophiala xenobiotica]KAK5289270.1 putative PHD type zinc finger protein with BAH domain-containing protein [Exophiala xenobiotica]KAK5338243.1 putative PHD type zinc finger protein with BAH domain-contai